MTDNTLVELVNISITQEQMILVICSVVFGVFCGWLVVRYQYAMRHKTLVLETLDLKNQLAQQVQVSRAEWEPQVHQQALETARLQAELRAAQSRVESLGGELNELHTLRARYVQAETRLSEQQLQREQEKRLLDETKQQLFREFELAANKLFDAKQAQFTSSSRSTIEAVITPFKEQLKDFHKKVDDVYSKENNQRNQLLGQISELQKQATKISADANNLAAALKGDNKAQGNWGEIILERLLEQSGLEKGREYTTQKSHADAEGKRYKPDVIVHLPEGKDIVIDSKVSLVDYERFCVEQDTSARETLLKRHVDSLRAHIKGLSLKQYEQLEGVRTLDFVFIFVPIEAAYITAIQAAPALFKEAYDKNIVLVSPSSLMVALRTVETLWRYEKQNTNAETIAASAGKLYDQFVMVVAAIEDIGSHLDRATRAYDTTRKRLTDGRGNLIRRVENLRDLGAKTSKNLPDKLRSEALDSDSEPESLAVEKTENMES
ncbi:DNA recombination protein RmuC [Teredinibacter waterburyi]|uniref:DNA recombination protein RmuC n=1 Tax=Teredinibacter waterburyi TaxID=1500538 RepID=UPI001FE6F455|nr:DNA recombination protein RmuC [Teredinibacter waterburyi]